MNKYKIIKNAQPGEVIHVSYHLAAMEELTDRLAKVERERDNLQKDVVAAFRKHGLAHGPTAIDGLVRQLAEIKEERDELKRVKSCKLCEYVFSSQYELPCKNCMWRSVRHDNFKPRDPSAEQGGGK